MLRSVTAIADKLGLEFALFHRKRGGKSQDAPEQMELLVGDVRGKVRSRSVFGSLALCRFDWACPGCDSGRRYDRHWDDVGTGSKVFE